MLITTNQLPLESPHPPESIGGPARRQMAFSKVAAQQTPGVVCRKESSPSDIVRPMSPMPPGSEPSCYPASEGVAPTLSLPRHAGQLPFARNPDNAPAFVRVADSMF